MTNGGVQQNSFNTSFMNQPTVFDSSYKQQHFSDSNISNYQSNYGGSNQMASAMGST